ncbi:SGNH/GDSL hydrolase N-terminal domain-containing protein [Hoylesella timonensis]|uniref:SGNH/GDSL hydrolase N-terminal domain-containing protein n=1 Tax=Hoylesella timonensis TaxID=386414 RepID=UPI00068EFE4B|nr:SGNH/GDSL hydrolase N-terminal domain-containing protein [Hoylesella timonensis]
MLKKLICLLLIGCYFPTLYAQTVWYHPQEQKDMPISGRGWGNETGKTYHRFPIRFKKEVRETLWNLSENSSGLYIDFTTDATDIAVKYTVTCPKI